MPTATSNHVVIQMTEPELFECPFVMMTEVGAATSRPEEAKAMRTVPAEGRIPVGGRFVGRVRLGALGQRAAEGAAGGRVSDFRCADESLDVSHALRREALPADSVDRLDEQPDDVGARRRQRHRHTPARLPIDKGRIMVFISHNTDFGDAYEREGDDPTYFYTVLRRWLRARHQHPSLRDDALRGQTRCQKVS